MPVQTLHIEGETWGNACHTTSSCVIRYHGHCFQESQLTLDSIIDWAKLKICCIDAVHAVFYPYNKLLANIRPLLPSI